jgi:hypothetical protein
MNKALKKIYDRTITLEVFTNRSDVKASAIKHKNLWTNLP